MGGQLISKKNSEGVRCNVLDAMDLLLPHMLSVMYVTRPMKPQKISKDMISIIRVSALSGLSAIFIG